MLELILHSEITITTSIFRYRRNYETIYKWA